MEKEKIMRIDDVFLPSDFYPRDKTTDSVVQKYSEAMKEGADFPPIKVGKVKECKTGRIYLCDGLHRMEAKELIGETHIKVVEKQYETFEDLFLDSVQSNLCHGLQFNQQDRAKIIKKFSRLKFEPEKIQKIMRIPITTINAIKSGKKIIPFTIAKAKKEKPDPGRNEFHKATQLIISFLEENDNDFSDWETSQLKKIFQLLRTEFGDDLNENN